MEVARWICFQMYIQNPYIKTPKASTPQAYHRFPWEGMTPEEVESAKENCIVTEQQQAELNKILNEVYGKQI